MKNKIKVVGMGVLFAGSFFVLLALTFDKGTVDGDWIAPISVDKLVNPVKGKEASTESGKKLFKQMCTICHGKAGKGDGMAGMSLNPRPTNFTTAKVQSQSDGAIFWKLSEGRAPMASYKNILEEEERWQLVNFIRTLNK